MLTLVVFYLVTLYLAIVFAVGYAVSVPLGWVALRLAERSAAGTPDGRSRRLRGMALVAWEMSILVLIAPVGTVIYLVGICATQHNC